MDAVNEYLYRYTKKNMSGKNIGLVYMQKPKTLPHVDLDLRLWFMYRVLNLF